MEDLNIPIFAQAKVEYTKQLIEILYSHMYDGIRSIYDEAKIIYSNKTTTPILLIFRELLEKVPIWNSEIIETETDRIMKVSSCDWLDDLITAVFISHTKILTSIGPNKNETKVNLKIPKTTTWVFVGMLAGRELAIASFTGKMKFKSVFPLVARDFQKMMIGLGASVAIVLAIHYVLVPNGF